ncbi:MAG TPA: YceD family protein [Candidatus Nanopelagicaceae bacterium]
MATSNSFLFNCHDLPRRAGEMREYQLTIDDHEPIGVPLLAIPSDSPIFLDLRIESVEQGVLATGTASGEALGECIRCLDPVTFDVEESFQELFHYQVDYRQKTPSSGKGKTPVIEVGDEDELLEMAGDLIDLEGPIRDALILNLPINPLCEEACEGLCPTCGVKWAELPEDHVHAATNIKWAGLADWKGPNA